MLGQINVYYHVWYKRVLSAVESVLSPALRSAAVLRERIVLCITHADMYLIPP
jgi:hypothetical protein